jgi:predicted Zn-dependent peptidase
MRDYEMFSLPNGIRVIHKQVSNTKIVHCGFILDIGSRDELAHQQGIAHFWEHMAFQGTRKRKAFHILNRLESVGGELNAYTTKEKICFYASVLDPFFENAIELLTDITFDSIFPPKQIDKERRVILEEMAMYLDTPEDALQDEFDKVVFGNHPLGNNILGTEESVKSFSRKNFKEFISENLDTSRLIFSCVGNISLDHVKKFSRKHLVKIPSKYNNRKRKPFGDYLPKNETKYRNIIQAQCAIGCPAYPIGNERRLPFFMLVNILGGPGMNSRLNLALREKHGFAYSIDANYNPFMDTGLFSILFGTDPKQLERSVHIVFKELEKLKSKSLGKVQLHRAKEQLMGQLAMAEENNTSLMLMMGRSMLDLDKIDSLETVFDHIRKIKSRDLQNIAHEIFEFDSLSMLKFVGNA